MSTDQPEQATAQFPTQDEWQQFVRNQNRQFDIADLLVKMKDHAEAIIEANPPTVTKTATSTGWKLPEIASLAKSVLTHRDQVRSCIRQDDPAGAAAHAIQLDRAYHAMVHYRLRPASQYGIDHLFLWRDEWIDAPKTARDILGCFDGERDRVPVCELMKATSTDSRGTLKTQISRATTCIEHLGYELQVREEFVNVSYT